MKKLSMISGLLLAALLLNGCATTQTAAASTDWEDEWVDQHVDLVVHGLSCPLCATNLDQQVKRIDGVRDSWIDLDTGRLRVEVEEGALVPVKDLARAVDQAGFTLQGVEKP